MTVPPESTRLRSDAVASRKAIAVAASRLYAERGIDVPFEDIARAAGVGKSTLYRHFPAREDLFAAILDDLMDDLQAVADATPATPDSFLTLFDALIDLAVSHPAVLAMLPKPTLPDAAAARRRERLFAMIREPLARARQAGLVRDSITVDDVRILFVMLSSLAQPHLADSDRARARQLAHQSMLA